MFIARKQRSGQISLISMVTRGLPDLTFALMVSLSHFTLWSTIFLLQL